MHINESLGKKLRDLRTEREWTQQGVALMLGVTVGAVSKIENGVTDINFSRLEQLADVYDLQISELLDIPPAIPAGYTDELRVAEEKLTVYDHTIIQLQEKIIYLFEQMQENALCSK